MNDKLAFHLHLKDPLPLTGKASAFGRDQIPDTQTSSGLVASYATSI